MTDWQPIETAPNGPALLLITIRSMWRRCRAVWLRRWRAQHPMCSQCGSRVLSGPNNTPECNCYYVSLARRLEHERNVHNYDC
jgi:hypothetical protein